jgi:murein L,D-transpeptidase YcbB/YkuD
MFFNEGVKLATKSLSQFLNQISLAKAQSQQGGLSIYDWPNLFSPKASEYQTLKALLAKLKNIDAQGGFVSVVLSTGGKSIRPGQKGQEIIPLRKRLYQQGYAISNLNSTEYDAEVLRAVTLFQKEAGLTADGVIGPKTQTAFNFSVKQRLRQVELNLERFRWYPQDFGNRFIYVNIASQKFYLQENGNKVLTMKVIVGKPDRKTPMLVDRSSSVVLNPAWVVPPTVFREDVFPFLKVNDLSILNKKRLTIFNDDDQPVDPNSVNWSKYSADNVPYYFKQVAGYSGALGVLKFNLSNPYAIYLHDTGLRSLFNEEVRYLSSGCVRLEKPVELATYLLKDKMAEADIRSALLENDNVPPEKESERRVSYNQSIPVYINYMTADLDVDGHMVFYNDTYQADANLHKRW